MNTYSDTTAETLMEHSMIAAHSYYVPDAVETINKLGLKLTDGEKHNL